MKITEEQKKIIQENFKKHWENKKCPFCKNNNWTLSETILELREFEGGGLNIGKSQIMPVISLICDTCSNTIFLNAIKLGIIEKEEYKKNGEKNKKK